MRSAIKSPITIGAAMVAALTLTLGAGHALARSSKHKTVVVVHPFYLPAFALCSLLLLGVESVFALLDL
jgi:hypothetical protein